MPRAALLIIVILLVVAGCFSSPAPSQVPQLPPAMVTQKEGVAVPAKFPPEFMAIVARLQRQLEEALKKRPTTDGPDWLTANVEWIRTVSETVGAIKGWQMSAEAFAPGALPTSAPEIKQPPPPPAPPKEPPKDAPDDEPGFFAKVRDFGTSLFHKWGVVCLVAGLAILIVHAIQIYLAWHLKGLGFIATLLGMWKHLAIGAGLIGLFVLNFTVPWWTFGGFLLLGTAYGVFLYEKRAAKRAATAEGKG